MPGVCGVVPGSVHAHSVGVEAGLSAVGDAFHAIAQRAQTSVADLSGQVQGYSAAQTGLLRMVWDNGDRTVLVNPDLGGVTLGWNLSRTAADEFFAAIEGTAMHTRITLERMEVYGTNIMRVINGGGIPKRNPALNQVYAKAQTKSALQETTSLQYHTGVPALASEYQKWLDEDVRWNITPAERTVFLHLSSDAERDHFIQQFWLRRDAAGTPLNSARGEHYQRIAYANQHFTASRPGWETDRGRIYILYGAPTSIDAHTPDGHSDKPYEVWGYDNALDLGHHVELRFVDTCKCGDYELISEPEVTVIPSGRRDKALYDKGLAQIEQGKYEVARLSLQTLLNNYPASPFAQSAQHCHQLGSTRRCGGDAAV